MGPQAEDLVRSMLQYEESRHAPRGIVSIMRTEKTQLRIGWSVASVWSPVSVGIGERNGVNNQT